MKCLQRGKYECWVEKSLFGVSLPNDPLGKIVAIHFVRTSFGLDPKTGMDSSPISPNNKFVERERKS